MSPRRTPSILDEAQEHQELADAEAATAKAEREAAAAAQNDEIPIFAPEPEIDPALAEPADLGPVASTYVNTTHPDTGEHIVFVPGDALPEWARRPTQ